MGWTAETAQSLSGTSVDFTSLPSCNIIQIPYSGLVNDETSDQLIQLGTSGGIKTTGYTSIGIIQNTTNFVVDTYTSGFPIPRTDQGPVGVMTLVNLTADEWVATLSGTRGDSVVTHVAAGRVDLAGTLTQIRVTTDTGTGTFSAGKVNILTATWERETVIDASGGGVPHTFTDLPAGIEAAYLVFDQVALDGTDHWAVQLGDTSGWYTTNYEAGGFVRAGVSTDDKTNSATAAGLSIFSGGTGAKTGMMRLVKPRDHYWVATHVLSNLSTNSIYGVGKRQITNALSKIRANVTGTDDTTAGQIGLLYI